MGIETPIWIEMLGGMDLIVGGQEPVALPFQKMGSLLAFLAFQKERAHDREQIIAHFWPDLDQAHGQSALRSVLLRIKERFGGINALQSNRIRISLNPVLVRTDVETFQSLLREASRLPQNAPERRQRQEEAIQLYKGPLLPTYDDLWIAGERQRLHESYLTALRSIAQSYLHEGILDQAMEFASRALLEDPYDEDAHRIRVQIYLKSGQPASAINHVRELEHTFREDLQRKPSPAIYALLESVHVPTQTVTAIDPTLRAGSTLSWHLPIEISRFIGRDKELSDLITLVSEGARLINLMGTGGVGKTRLAIEVGRLWEKEKIPVFWVPLSEVEPNAPLMDIIVGALRQVVPPSPQPVTAHRDASEEEAVVLLNRAPSILILDNMEHINETALRKVIKSLLQRVPTLRILGTSRRRLGISGEQLYSIVPLSRPTQHDTLEQAMQYPSIRLMVDRARLVKPDFALTEALLPSAKALCDRLDGLPLAIEMASARLSFFTLPTVLEKIEDNYQLLTNTNADVPARHRSLQATIQWSLDLLTSDQVLFLIRVSFFRGGCSCSAIEHIFAYEDCSELLLELCDLSLINSFDADQSISIDNKRYFVPDLIRNIVIIENKILNISEIVKNTVSYYEKAIDNAYYAEKRAIKARFIAEESKNISLIVGLMIDELNEINECANFVAKIIYSWLDSIQNKEAIRKSVDLLKKVTISQLVDKNLSKNISYIIELLIISYSSNSNKELLISLTNICNMSTPYSGEKFFHKEDNLLRCVQYFNSGNMDDYRKLLKKGVKLTGRYEIEINCAFAFIRDGQFVDAIKEVSPIIGDLSANQFERNSSMLPFICAKLGLGLLENLDIELIKLINYFSSIRINRGKRYSEWLLARLYVKTNRANEGIRMLENILINSSATGDWNLICLVLESIIEYFIKNKDHENVRIIMILCSLIRGRCGWEKTAYEQFEWNAYERHLYGMNPHASLTFSPNQELVPLSELLETAFNSVFKKGLNPL